MIFELVGDFADALAALVAEHPKQRLLRLLDLLEEGSSASDGVLLVVWRA